MIDHFLELLAILLSISKDKKPHDFDYSGSKIKVLYDTRRIESAAEICRVKSTSTPSKSLCLI